MFNWQDYDGSATQRTGPTIVGSWPSWWQLAPDCSYEVSCRAGQGGQPHVPQQQLLCTDWARAACDSGSKGQVPPARPRAGRAWCTLEAALPCPVFILPPHTPPVCVEPAERVECLGVPLAAGPGGGPR